MMDRMGRRLLILGAALSAALALLHVGIVFVGEPAYAYFGPEDLARLAEQGSWVPALSTLVVAGTLFGFALMAASGAGLVRKVMLLPVVLLGVSVLYTLRGAFVVPQVLLMYYGMEYPVRQVVFSAVSLFVGLVHVAGVGLRWQFLLGKHD